MIDNSALKIVIYWSTFCLHFNQLKLINYPFTGLSMVHYIAFVLTICNCWKSTIPQSWVLGRRKRNMLSNSWVIRMIIWWLISVKGKSWKSLCSAANFRNANANDENNFGRQLLPQLPIIPRVHTYQRSIRSGRTVLKRV